MKRKKGLFSGIGRRLDIPCEALPGGFGLSMSGQSELTVRGCRHILSYGEECILLSLGRVQLSIGGVGLLCTVFDAGSVTVQGKISSLCFKRGSEE